MDRRKFIAGIGALSAAGAVGTGAFTSASADRTVSVSVAGDASAFLAMDTSGTANGEFASINSDQIELDFSESSAGGDGLGLDSTYEFDDVFRITNQGTQPVYVWANFSGGSLDDDDIWFYPDSNSDRELNDGTNEVVTLPVGETVEVGVHIDTSTLSSTGTENLTATLSASVGVPNSSSPTDPSGEDAAVVSENPDDGEYSSIQTAINEVDGTTIYVEDGVYDEQLRIGKDDLTIEGESRDGVIIRPTSFESVNARGKEAVTINPVVPEEAGGDPSLTNESWWRSQRGHYEVSGVTLRNLTIDGVNDDDNRAGIYAAHAEDYTIENVVCKNHGELGTNGGVGSGNGWCRNATFRNVEFVDNGDGGMLAFRSDGFTIDGLTVENCGGDGVDIHGDDHTLTDVTVYGSGTNGIEFTQGGNNVLQDSEVYDNGTGIDIEKIGSDSIDPKPGETEITIESTDIYDNGTGLRIGKGGSHDHDDLGVDAAGNWWGSANGPNSAEGDDIVIADGIDPVLNLATWLDGPVGSGSPVYGAGFVKPGANTLDIDGDGVTEMGVESASDPADSGDVAHVTSAGSETTDFATSAVQLNPDDPPTLGELTDGTTDLVYEYYEGVDNSGAAPDEVYLLIAESDGTRHVVFHTSNDNKHLNSPPSDETWLSRNVHKEIAGNPDPEDNPNYNWREFTAEGYPSLGSADGTDLSDEFGDDAELITVAAGRGGTSGTTADVYYRDLQCDGDTYGFPTE
ncbi:right-handed parallel beta-helix repeat-containing protein [Halolamina sp. CBA1230]|uniref:right-handed parallel beta-helix repeat-containing protein n=1 Tax=Halolamina sp. CBA1230 TaxID=1853690 RepID=UPI001301A105|nr:right-handed parallel beta-helix repeat-containing protein [Halolamina sp. CBA1230]QKY20961.1 right-handed parallel beta-helix repeat-containing protein [Halolamina sp. CBA1230]